MVRPSTGRTTFGDPFPYKLTEPNEAIHKDVPTRSEAFLSVFPRWGSGGPCGEPLVEDVEPAP